MSANGPCCKNSCLFATIRAHSRKLASKYSRMQAWKEYQEKNKDRFLNELLEMLRIPSVSANSDHKDDMKKCAEMVTQRLLEAGADKAEVYPTDGHPVVVAEKIIDPSKPTV